jgi:hypothetical protein
MKKIIIFLFIMSNFLLADYIRDSQNNIVLNNTNFLVWQDDVSVKTNSHTWIEAINYCESLGLGGYTDWRLPNINELTTLLDIAKFNPAIEDAFVVNINTSKIYWSSTSTKFDLSNAWIINFLYGESVSSSKISSNGTRCVRNFK